MLYKMSSLKAGVIREQVSKASELLVTITNDQASHAVYFREVHRSCVESVQAMRPITYLA